MDISPAWIAFGETHGGGRPLERARSDKLLSYLFLLIYVLLMHVRKVCHERHEGCCL